MTTPTIYRITTSGATPSPGSSQFLGYQVVNGTLVPNPSSGIFSDDLGNILSGASDYLGGGFGVRSCIATIPNLQNAQATK